MHGIGLLEQLWLEEALLASRARTWPWDVCVLLNAPFAAPPEMTTGGRGGFPERAAVVGVAQRAEEVLRTEAAADGLDVLQRYSAGGAVVVGRRGTLMLSVLGGDAALEAQQRPAYPSQLLDFAAPAMVDPWPPLAHVEACGHHYHVD